MSPSHRVMRSSIVCRCVTNHHLLWTLLVECLVRRFPAATSLFRRLVESNEIRPAAPASVSERCRRGLGYSRKRNGLASGSLTNMRLKPLRAHLWVGRRGHCPDFPRDYPLASVSVAMPSRTRSRTVPGQHDATSPRFLTPSTLAHRCGRRGSATRGRCPAPTP